MPHNTGGGQLSMGQAGAAGGFLGLVEAMRQLLGEARGRQVAKARRALVSGFGMINCDRGLCTAAAYPVVSMIRLQRCDACGKAGQYPAREVCGACLSGLLAWDRRRIHCPAACWPARGYTTATSSYSARACR